MKRWIAILVLVAVAPVLADDAEKYETQARELERKAAALLDQGRRAEAFDLLARASELREKARRARGTRPAKAKGKAPAAHPKAAAGKALEQLDAALKANDMQAARTAAVRMRRQLVAWEKQLGQREKALAAGADKRGRAPDRARLMARIDRLEQQVKELSEMLRRAR